jgi:hypothetical protein
MRPQQNRIGNDQMRDKSMRTNSAINTSRFLVSSSRILAATALLVLCCSQLTLAQQPQPRTFASAGQAAQALYDAVKGNDEEALHAILGAGPELTSSGSDPDDKINRDRFVKKYQEMHRLVREADGLTFLHIGAENWPFPIPLVSKGGKWYFDADTGSQELLARDIGSNEITAIQVCQAFHELRAPHAPKTSGADPIQEFAVTLANGKETDSTDGHQFHGYYFRRVAGQPADRVLIAYPAEYRSSGVMTFVVTGSGAVKEKDLGQQTAPAAQQIEGKPAADWVPADR